MHAVSILCVALASSLTFSFPLSVPFGSPKLDLLCPHVSGSNWTDPTSKYIYPIRCEDRLGGDLWLPNWHQLQGLTCLETCLAACSHIDLCVGATFNQITLDCRLKSFIGSSSITGGSVAFAPKTRRIN